MGMGQLSRMMSEKPFREPLKRAVLSIAENGGGAGVRLAKRRKSK
jgi:hypothetical protein